ncbi:zinc finger MYM-type protein 1-like [Ostrea edulis]|uniref:zinc finger MYM-type protein 1-like n=1 Tax=Ostrea edulis TaxID=37623 RepID=UPI00209660CE|nr:zinc finger MYM-type protein 1-like [Ostrea edulis]XP_048730003.1 zinc finger MYM-type protein 1-like [Ostrea edulis]XP_055998579.1 zinc finger MYM-type protein 1-like [Ostrea edulis]
MSFKQSKLGAYFSKRTPEEDPQEPHDPSSSTDVPSQEPTSDIDMQEPSRSSSENVPSTTKSPSPSDNPQMNFTHHEDPIKFIDRNLTEYERQQLLEHKWVPDSKFRYPVNEQGRRYNNSWEEKRPWLRYSLSNESAFCAYCIAFPVTVSETNPEFVKIGFRDWKNAMGDKRGALDKHSKSERHKLSQEKCEMFLMTIKGEKEQVTESISKAHQEKIKRNRACLISIIDVIIRLGHRNIAFRGNWIKEDGKEDGNFQYFIDWKAKFDDVLSLHLSTAQYKYLSPKVQNEFINLCELEIREAIRDRCTESEFFSVMADETTDVSEKAQLSICVRYVNMEEDGYKVNEDFLGFLEVDQTDAQTISDVILHNLGQNWSFDLTKLRGQGYDGCATMSGAISGVQKRIQEAHPEAKYFVHCNSHRLNLVIVNTCNKVVEARNALTILGKITWFICGVSKRKAILMKEVQEANKDLDFDLLYENEDALFEAAMRQTMMPKLSETRWTSRVDTLSWLLAHYKSLLNVLETVQSKSKGQAAADASSYHAVLLKFDFIVVVVMLQYTLGYIRPLSILLQSESCDLVKAHQEARDLLLIFQGIRSDSDRKFHDLYERSESIGDENNVVPTKPRIAQRQRHRANAPVESIEDHYRVNYFLPFIDHIISHLNSRFPEELKAIFYGNYLVPALLNKINPEIVNAMKTEYMNDLPHPNDLQQEIDRWAATCVRANLQSVKTLTDSIKYADVELYPNIHVILKLLLTLPVGSCACERSFSALRRLKTWCRATMTENRLCGLAMLHVHRNDNAGKVSPEAVLKRWDLSGTRKIELAFTDTD